LREVPKIALSLNGCVANFWNLP